MATEAKTNLFGLAPSAMRDFFVEMGEKPFRAAQVLQWIHHYGADNFDGMTNIGRTLRQRLTDVAEVVAPQIALDQEAADGTRKWLLRLADGNCIETVFIPEEGRGTLCVSSQVGCTLNCSFCATGHQGFNRNLDAGEIIAQVWVANRALGRDPRGERLITNVVMMGMGEPLLNFENVVTSLNLMLDDSAYGLSRRRVTVSTSGVIPAMDRLGERCPVALAVSLHAPNDALRDVLVPINKKYPLKELMAACRRYIEHAPRDFVTFEYVMLDGVNDSVSHARELVKLVKDVPSKFNLIPFNPFPHSGYGRSKDPAIEAFKAVLMDSGLVVTTRRTRGDDIDAACGQLAGKVMDRTRRSGAAA